MMKLLEKNERTFLWVLNSYQNKISFRAELERNLFEISRHELFGLMDSNPQLGVNNDQVRDLANILGVKRLSKKAQKYLSQCSSLYFDSKSQN